MNEAPKRDALHEMNLNKSMSKFGNSKPYYDDHRGRRTVDSKTPMADDKEVKIELAKKMYQQGFYRDQIEKKLNMSLKGVQL